MTKKPTTITQPPNSIINHKLTDNEQQMVNEQTTNAQQLDEYLVELNLSLNTDFFGGELPSVEKEPGQTVQIKF